jgi:hypothetical protein
MTIITTEKIDFAMTRQTHRFDRVIPAGSVIQNIQVINDRFSAFSSPDVVDAKTGIAVEMYASTDRIHTILSEVSDMEDAIAV